MLQAVELTVWKRLFGILENKEDPFSAMENLVGELPWAEIEAADNTFRSYFVPGKLRIRPHLLISLHGQSRYKRNRPHIAIIV